MKKYILAALLAVVSVHVSARSIVDSLIHTAMKEVADSPSAETYKSNLNAGTKLEVGFSPEGSGEALVLKVINSAQKELKVMAYSFTSPSVVKAIINAKRRGVDVMVLADSSNIAPKQKYGRAALSALVEAGVAVRTIDAYSIFHDKILLVDNKTLETGSFNYSANARSRNSENVLVLWNAPEAVAPYLTHWKSRWPQGSNFKQGY